MADWVKRRYRVAGRLLGLAIVLALASAAARAESAAVLRVAREDFSCPVAQGRDACALELLATLRARAEEAFVVARGLRATDTEVAELIAYNEAFERHDRKQRARKLQELDARLADGVDGTEREQLERFRAVLVRLASYEADVDAGTEVRVAIPIETLRHWVETVKLDAALYARYGGSVGLRPSGPYAHGARATLVADYLATLGVQFLDGDIERHFNALLAAPPRVPFQRATPDFTPFWRRPIPPSYMAE